jgi:hypothetical protein
MAIWDSLQSSLYDLILTIIGVVIADLAVATFLARRGKPKIAIDTVREGDKLGFKVSVDRRTIKNARVRCNNMSYDWKVEPSGETGYKDLLVGDEPSSFFPFQVSADYGNTKVKFQVNQQTVGPYNAVLISVKEITTQKNILRNVIPISKEMASFFYFAPYADEPHFDVSIRIIGEGIEEVKDYSLHVGLNSLSIPIIKEGKPLMDYISYSFELKKKWILFQRKRRKLI